MVAGHMNSVRSSYDFYFNLKFLLAWPRMGVWRLVVSYLVPLPMIVSAFSNAETDRVLGDIGIELGAEQANTGKEGACTTSGRVLNTLDVNQHIHR